MDGWKDREQGSCRVQMVGFAMSPTTGAPVPRVGMNLASCHSPALKHTGGARIQPRGELRRGCSCLEAGKRLCKA